MGELTAMNITTIKAKSLVAATAIVQHTVSTIEQYGIYGEKEPIPQLAQLIENAFTANIEAAEERYVVAPFSQIIGCGIYCAGIPQTGRAVCIIPPQWPDPVVPAVMDRNEKYRISKLETERKARLVCAALNAS